MPDQPEHHSSQVHYSSPHRAGETTSFDELAKGLAEGKLTRRKALRLLGATLVGGVLASVPSIAWAAKPAPCPSGNKCGKNCCPDATFVCSQGKCACPTGQTACGGQCVRLTTNQNCGSCGNACSGGKTCQSGVCACPQGQSECGGVCRDLTTDVAHCGLCGNACAQGASCVGGQCVCPSGQEVCSGQCVSSCMGRQLLNATTCECECPTGTTLCPGNNSCVQDCSQGQTLNATTCQCENIVCPTGTVLCGGQCVSTSCSSGKVFNVATCQCEACPAGHEPCGGQCVQSCSGGQVLDPTTCQCVCPSGTALCNGSCVRLTTNQNCGSCGNACPGGASCVDGKCICPAGTCFANGSCYRTSCQNGAFFSDIECECVCPPELPSECRIPGQPNARGCCPPGTVCKFALGGGIVCTPV